MILYYLWSKYNENLLSVWAESMEEKYPRIMEVKKMIRKVIIKRKGGTSEGIMKCT